MQQDALTRLRIEPAARRRPRGAFAGIVLAVGALSLGALWFAWPRAADERRVVATPGALAGGTPPPAAATVPAATPAPSSGDVALVASGYIVNRERIELSPRFVGVVKWIGVKKGDTVRKDEVVVLLDDAEQQARLREAGGVLDQARARVEKARLDHARARRLQSIDSEKLLDDARIETVAAEAALKQAEGAVDLARTYVEWTVIRAPVDGVVLEKLVDPGELVTPQSFGGTRGPSTAFLALADPNDLQIEIDVGEGDLAKIAPGQPCRVSPEAFPEKTYAGYVAEIAPEANRAKGTLQVKVQVRDPDRFLTPELSAKVEFLATGVR